MKETSRVAVCSSFFARMKGLFSSRVRECDYIILVPCGAVHTFGMKTPIDVAFVDEQGTVVKSLRNVTKGKRLRCKNACAVVERFARSGAWFEGGDSLFAAISEENERRTQ